MIVPTLPCNLAATSAKQDWRRVLLVLLLVLVTGISGCIAHALWHRTATEAAAEALTVAQISLLAPHQITVDVTNNGARALTVAQVQVDDAYWTFAIAPQATIDAGGSATITLPYPWTPDETHVVTLVSSRGATFADTLSASDQIAPAPKSSWALYASLAISAVCGTLLVLAITRYAVRRSRWHSNKHVKV